MSTAWEVISPHDWNSDTKIGMEGGAGGDLLFRKGILRNSIFD